MLLVLWEISLDKAVFVAKRMFLYRCFVCFFCILNHGYTFLMKSELNHAQRIMYKYFSLLAMRRWLIKKWLLSSPQVVFTLPFPSRTLK